MVGGRGFLFYLFILFYLYLTRLVIKNKFLFIMAAWQRQKLLEEKGTRTRGVSKDNG